MNTTHDDKALGTADFGAAADRGGQAPPPETGDQPDMREIRGEGELQGMREEGDRYEQMRESDRGTAGGRSGDQGEHHAEQQGEQQREQQGEPLAPLFLPQMAQGFKAQWNEVQIGFVDDPAQAVRHADELVAQVMQNLAQTFAEERSNVESHMDEGDTELMRVALRRYRSFFQRLLSL